MNQRMKHAPLTVTLSAAVTEIERRIRQDRGDAHAQGYLRELRQTHERETRPNWPKIPPGEHSATFIVIHARPVGDQAIPTIVSVEFVRDEDSEHGAERTLFLLHISEAMSIPKLAMMIDAQRATGHVKGTLYGIGNPELN